MLRQVLGRNLLWFLLSLVLAVLVWVTAVSESNPFEQRRLTGVPLRINLDPGLIITNEGSLPSTATVQLVGQRNELGLLTTDDIVVTADLLGLAPGTHTVPLKGEAARDADVSTVIPSQITVDIEIIASQQVPIQARIINEPPPDMEVGEPQFDVLQIEVSGPQSRVQQVVNVEVPIDLRDQRSDFEDDVRLIPVDADGNTVTDVTLAPQVVHVVVPITQSANIREINVSPRPEGEPPEGYYLTSVDYDPTTVFVSAPNSVLENLPDTLFTTPINLEGRTSDFQVTVPVDFEDTNLTPLSESNITVTIGIQAQTATRQLDDVRVEQIGGVEGYSYQLEPSEVSLIVTAPQPVLDRLTENDVRVTADVSGLSAAGTFSIVPSASLIELNVDSTITILPAQIDVMVEAVDQTPEATDSRAGGR